MCPTTYSHSPYITNRPRLVAWPLSTNALLSGQLLSSFLAIPAAWQQSNTFFQPMIPTPQ